jgi:hypothetical protein
VSWSLEAVVLVMYLIIEADKARAKCLDSLLVSGCLIYLTL